MEIAMSSQERERERVQGAGDARFGIVAGQRARVPGAGARQAIWSAVAGLAIVVVLFIVFYGLSSQQGTSPNQPAVMASPSPAAGVPARAPEGTTGQGSRAPQTGREPAEQKPAEDQGAR